MEIQWQPEPSSDPVDGEMEALLQPEQLQQEMAWMQGFTRSLDDEIRHDDPEYVVSEYLREPTPEQGEGETGPAEELMPILIEDTDEEDPLTPDGYGYQLHEEEDSPEQAPAPQDEEEPEAVEQGEEEEPDEEEEPEAAEEQDEEVEGEDEIEIEIEVNVEIEMEVEEEEELEEDEDEDEWPLGDFEEGEEGELIVPEGEEEEQPDDDGWEDDDEDGDSEASTVTDA